jgi:hypothetical protein
MSSVTMSRMQRRVMVALRDAATVPDLITLPREHWHELYGGYSKTVQDNYGVMGFYWVCRRKSRPVRTIAQIRDATLAIMYKGIPVVIREDYEDMMAGHTSRRKVLEV